MKTRESGMPEEELWESFFRPTETLRALGLSPEVYDVVEFGCGYGTFTIPAAQITRGTVYALDVESEMIVRTTDRAAEAGSTNVKAILRDFVAEGTGLPDNTVRYAMLFNILHAEAPMMLLNEAWRVLVPSGILAVMHWNYDPSTPRGPSMDIRPKPEQCRDLAIKAGFTLLPPGIISLPPYHYGMAMAKVPLSDH